MIEPVDPSDMLVSFVAAALIILLGAGYAALYAWAKLQARNGLLVGAYACYGLLAIAVAVLAETNHLRDGWRFIVLLMLVGYLLAPHAIWKLVRRTHDDDDDRHEDSDETQDHIQNNPPGRTP